MQAQICLQLDSELNLYTAAQVNKLLESFGEKNIVDLITLTNITETNTHWLTYSCNDTEHKQIRNINLSLADTWSI